MNEFQTYFGKYWQVPLCIENLYKNGINKLEDSCLMTIFRPTFGQSPQDLLAAGIISLNLKSQIFRE